MKTSRRIAVATAMVTALLIPATARAADDGANCVGKSMRVFRTALRLVAQDGGVQGLVEDIRTRPENYPWC